MPADDFEARKLFERGVAVISIDTEQVWGYMGPLSEPQFRRRYPGAMEAHDKLLKHLLAAGVGATWLVVGGMSLRECDGARDRRMAGLPADWTVKIPRGNEQTTPLWYRRSFVQRLRDASPRQEIGLHGGLTHLIWTDSCATRDVANWELAEGIRALGEVGVRPDSFSFGRDAEAYHELLPAHGIRAYRSRTGVFAYRLGRTPPGALMRLIDEARSATPPVVWPQETLPGLWNIPSSLFLYPLGRTRTRVAGLPTRIRRFSRGLEAAARHRAIFHFCLHPENLAESRHGFSVLEDILERLIRARDAGDVEVLTMRQVAARMEQSREAPPARAGREGTTCAGGARGTNEYVLTEEKP